ncbi:hypothetical protein SERLA73DRAFT_188091 [Serpula lacrymans var. lacrymans S7.3]|uniref:FAS1 domain-containing protein n=2 Tax=Serpula lacrymans var. lacrymans TaxID=341189 RepID=F8QAQ5_SERL3|nr:uncharacterized protein SERLADRAFT_478062 [Serpula lacrymans var. lacrymans S7.9]EGN94291.1 hypothetical protein SERLA73DRAFT_188091 [Serpula lacrymans var. lacrymans S7.3]EGO19780.1 hypothetical protein SERLADRAFT_478062 [Serpula lacrymans var. lacrymans S7.9]
MLFLLSFIILASVPAVIGQNLTYLTGLLQTLNASGLTQLASVAPSLNNTPSGQRILSTLPQGNWTLFAPNNAAFGALSSTDTGNTTFLTDTISYHIVSGNFTNETASYPNVTIGRTLLNDSSLVMLEGNKSQVLSWTKLGNGTTAVLNQNMNVSVTNTTQYENLEILVIEAVLIPPPNITSILTNGAYNLTSLSPILSQATLPGNTTTLLQALSSARGITVFAPNNAALSAAQSTLTNLTSNITALSALLSNHVINGTSVYSPLISSSTNYTSAGGEPLMFTTNSSGTYVSSGGSSTARIVRSDILAENGVVHVLDGVLADVQSNPSAASSAYASATSIAAVSTTQTGPLGPTGGSASGSRSGGAIELEPSFQVGGGIAILFSLLGQLA